MANAILLNGQRVGVDFSPNTQALLARAREAKDRPLCLCVARHHSECPSLYVIHSTRRNRYELKKMPGTGSLHASDCEHYEPPLSVSGLGQVMGQAITETEDSEIVNLRLDFALAKIEGRQPPTPKDTLSDSVKSDGTKLTIRSLLHYLWMQAGLNRWYPAMAGKRRYGVMYKHVTEAAHSKVTKGMALSDLLYVPEPSHPDRAPTVTPRMALARLASADKKNRRLGLVVGEVYKIEADSYGHRIKLIGALHDPFMLDEGIHRRMEKHFAQTLALWQAKAGETHLIAIASFSVDLAGVPRVHELALMLVSDTWLPIESVFELELLQTMLAQGRSFEKCLRFNLPASAPLATAVTLDTEQQHALFIVLPSASADHKEHIVEMTKKDQLQPWFWMVGAQPVPVLPPPKPKYADGTKSSASQHHIGTGR